MITLSEDFKKYVLPDLSKSCISDLGFRKYLYSNFQEISSIWILITATSFLVFNLQIPSPVAVRPPRSSASKSYLKV